MILLRLHINKKNTQGIYSTAVRNFTMNISRFGHCKAHAYRVSLLEFSKAKMSTYIMFRELKYRNNKMH